jgi:hypothetical protein
VRVLAIAPTCNRGQWLNGTLSACRMTDHRLKDRCLVWNVEGPGSPRSSKIGWAESQAGGSLSSSSSITSASDTRRLRFQHRFRAA